jgi:hypothetical protein
MLTGSTDRAQPYSLDFKRNPRRVPFVTSTGITFPVQRRLCCFGPSSSFPAPTEETGDLDGTLPPKEAVLWRCRRSGLLRETLRRRRSCGFYCDGDCLADPERNWRFSCNSDSDGKPLRESDAIDGLVDCRKQAGRSSARAILQEDAPGDAVDSSFKGLITVTHQRNFHCSVGLDRKGAGSL